MRKLKWICIVSIGCAVILLSCGNSGTDLQCCKGPRTDRDQDGIVDSAYLFETHGTAPYYQSIVDHHRESGDYDTELDCRICD